ncbi:GNAT family N-acetyltransferase [Paenibacillus filicis]|uniref:GNAT family N-acetyltransferase n=1 Tax=Paenibacillus gyeongsangnamensis TaxID=3388067 RepID=A0ABT4QLX4_9BACL|nr:GNAT family N-acetyltransferase [Paenibacillus filicis]MCZ8517735.1 GNAT family N-acetyltransferase [Paenibacillus filicis]
MPYVWAKYLINDQVLFLFFYRPKFEIGYWIDTRYSGNVYMTEAIQGITSYAFNELKARRIEIRCDSLISVDGNGLRDTCIYAKILN